MARIKIVGMGPSQLDQLPLGCYRLLTSGKKVFLRTADHPVVSQLEGQMVYESYDGFYEKYDEEFERVYPAIVADLLAKAIDQEELVYAVPGHPLVGETTTQLLLANDQGVEVEIVGGHSFIDDFFAALGVDPIDGFQLVDGLVFQAGQLQTNQHLVLMQVYHPFVAGDVKIELMEVYPDDHPVARVDAAGSDQEEVVWVPLHELDFFDGVHNLMSVYVPPLADKDRLAHFDILDQLGSTIFDPDQGDPWALQHDHHSLLPYLDEEAEEFKQAVASGDDDQVVEELGDLLLQVIYHAKLAENDYRFQLKDVIKGLNKKLIDRHPHLFEEGVQASTIEEVEDIWRQVKDQERKNDETR